METKMAWTRLLSLLLLSSLTFSSVAFAADDAPPRQPLQGGVEETGIQPSNSSQAVKKIIEEMPVPVVPKKPLQGRVGRMDQSTPMQGNVHEDDASALRGQLEDDGGLQPMKGIPDRPRYLK